MHIKIHMHPMHHWNKYYSFKWFMHSSMQLIINSMLIQVLPSFVCKLFWNQRKFMLLVQKFIKLTWELQVCNLLLGWILWIRSHQMPSMQLSMHNMQKLWGLYFMPGWFYIVPTKLCSRMPSEFLSRCFFSNLYKMFSQLQDLFQRY